MTTDLLIELGCEDLPARYVVPLADALSSGIVVGLNKRGIAHGDSRAYATPRRIAVIVSAVANTQPDQQIERFGPVIAAAFKNDAPTPAALGFAKSCGVEFAALAQKDGKLHYAKTEAGKNTIALIPEIFEETLKQMDELVPKRMRWGSGTETFVRPVQWMVALLGKDVIPLKRFDLTAGRSTYGHRFHAPAAIELATPAEYESKLKAAKVWADVASRKAEIKKQIETQAAALKGYARITDDLLDEVTALVELPVAITGHFEDRFLELPPEVIVATVETNQRYFTVFSDTAHTKLTNAFITISNVESRDVAQVIAGNERVVRPRLADALFFWRQDLKWSLEQYGDSLLTVTYQKDLGSIGAKVVKIRSLAKYIAQSLNADVTSIERAAELCKNDLVTKMVYEFPELQGLMGGYYAEKSGETSAVFKAIREHYLPTQQGTPIPSTHEGRIVALADKLDTLAGIFTIGQKPTASKDPFALRRAALGIVRILIEGKLPIDLAKCVPLALTHQLHSSNPVPVIPELIDFLMERQRSYYSDLPVEMFEAVKALGITAPFDFDQRVLALRSFWSLPAAMNLAAAHKRVRNILKQAGDSGSDSVNTKLFAHDAEKTLFAQITKLGSLNAKADYANKLTNLATLREPVDAFFDGVMVNDKDEAVRNNRIALLRQLDALCREVADISLLPG